MSKQIGLAFRVGVIVGVLTRRIDARVGARLYGPAMGSEASVLLDGLIGAMLGGFVTAGAVWATIRHEVRRGREDRAEVEARAAKSRAAQAEDAAVEAATIALGRLQGACIAFSMTAARRRLWPWELLRVKDEMVEITSSLAVARSRIVHRWPDTNLALERCSDELIAAMEAPEEVIQDAVQEACMSLVVACRAWLDTELTARK